MLVTVERSKIYQKLTVKINYWSNPVDQTYTEIRFNKVLSPKLTIKALSFLIRKSLHQKLAKFTNMLLIKMTSDKA